jgi:hypothetical protein
MRTGIHNLLIGVCFLGAAFTGRAVELFWGDATEGFQLALGFEKASSTSGEAVIATVVIKNTSDGVLRLPGYLADEQNYRFIVTRNQNEPVGENPRIRSGSALSLPIKPGESKTNHIRLDALFDLNELGSYIVTVTRSLPPASNPSAGFEQQVRIQSGNAILRVSGNVSERAITNGATVSPTSPRNITGNMRNTQEGSQIPSRDSSSNTSPDGNASKVTPTVEASPLSSKKMIGIGIVAGLCALLIAVLWRATRRNQQR